MKKYLLIIVVLLNLNNLQAQFDSIFISKSLRIDYTHAGNAETEWYALDELIEEPFWGGSKLNLIESFGYGEYAVKVFDARSMQLIYSHGY
ncbi:MAG: peptidase M64, partial [Bacteroidales bacterium]|nr:peptidase M64 [Bacteroidales bacterium]